MVVRVSGAARVMVARAKIYPERNASVVDVSRIGKHCAVRGVDGDNDNITITEATIHRINPRLKLLKIRVL